MPLLSQPVRLNDFYYKSIILGWQPNRAATIYHIHDKCSALLSGKSLIPYDPDLAGNNLTLCFDCRKLVEKDKGL
jgi:hypothetical protein